MKACRTQLNILADIVHADQDKLWLRVASRFYDRTGRRLAQKAIKEKMTGVRG